MKTKRIVAVITLLIGMLIFASMVSAQNVGKPTSIKDSIGRKIMDKVDEQPTPKLLQSETNMLIVRTYGDNNVKKELKVFDTYSKDYGENNKTLVEFKKPSSGIKVLRWSNENGDDDVWVKASTGGVKKLNSTGDKHDSFQGAHFTYEDMEDRNLDDYEFKYMGEEKITIKDRGDDRSDMRINTYKVAARKVRGEDSAYSFAYFYVLPDEFIVMRADLYDKDKKLHKMMEVLDITKMTGYDGVSYNITRNARMKIVGEENQYTEIKIGNIKIDSDAERSIKESLFKSENL